jgi:hypothetical protein
VRWARVDWDERELQIIRRYARGVVHGRYGSALAAARVCKPELDRVRPSAYCRPPKTVHDRLLREAHAMGMPRLPGRWTHAENQVLGRHVRALFEGRYRYVHEAAEACSRELRKLYHGHAKRAGGRFGETLPRSTAAVIGVLTQRLGRISLPRYRARLTKAETKLVRKHALAVARGRYPNWLEAAKACRAESMKLYARAPGSIPAALRKADGRSLHTVHTRILDVAHRLGLRGPRRVLWTPVELKVCAGWVRWHDRHRGARRRRHVFSEAVAGLQEDLEKLGHVRSHRACSHQLVRERRRMYGSA